MVWASPSALVLGDGVASAADAPLPGAAKVTVAPGAGFPKVSVTRATMGAPKAVLTTVVWVAPPVSAMFVAGPARLASPKLAAVPTPGAEAVTA